MRSLNLDSPIVAAPMAGGPTTPQLLHAVTAAGSLGFVPAGYRTAAQLSDDIADARSGSGQFGVNLFVPDPNPVDIAAVRRYRDLIAAEVEALGAEVGPIVPEDDDDWDAKVDLLARDPVPWVSFTFGLPDTTVVSRLRAAGSRLLMTVTNVDEARAAANLDPDGLVVQSADAGGHRGTFDQHRNPGTENLVSLVRAIVAATRIPAIAAGGLADQDSVRAVMDAGAEAVAIGTALLLADEAGTRSTHRAALTDPTATTTTMRAYTGRVARGVRTAFSDRYEPHVPAAYPAVHHFTSPMRRWAAQNDDPAHLHLWAGTGFRGAQEVPASRVLAALQP
ncbi:nitronate monooxygenase [Nocardioides insulae]|uniref:nitronate monooxygenase n=1 Tax=Nocardioides insulae TaxID=394734 RepID=UPI00040898A2|nr:nitronate monooxygenase [Nocardioides insulae]